VRRTGLTGWVKDRSACGAYREAMTRLIIAEDIYGIDAVAALSDRLTALAQEACCAGLLNPCEQCFAETRALAAADAIKARRATRAG
jgi:hypothetical protein